MSPKQKSPPPAPCAQYLLPFCFLALMIFGNILSVSARPADNKNKDERMDNMDERGKYLEGDMILQDGMKERAGIVGDRYRWPNATVVYQIDVDFDDRQRANILAGMEEIQQKTCIQFLQRTTETAYVFIAKGGPDSGCWSLIGRVGLTAQQLNLESPGCVTKGITIHELLHAIGFYHEQSREDRDSYVSVNWSNVQVGTEFNFFKALGSVTFNVSYDYGSIMHYSAYSFAKDPQVPTLITTDPDATIGQRLGLSAKDAYKVNAMYCPEENDK